MWFFISAYVLFDMGILLALFHCISTDNWIDQPFRLCGIFFAITVLGAIASVFLSATVNGYVGSLIYFAIGIACFRLAYIDATRARVIMALFTVYKLALNAYLVYHLRDFSMG